MADEVEIDERVAHHQSISDQMEEVSLSENPTGELLGGSEKVNALYSMDSIQFLIGQAPEGSLALNPEASSFHHDMRITTMTEGNHHVSAPKLAAWKNQNGSEFKQQTGQELDDAHMTFTLLSNGLGQGIGASVNSKTLRAIAEPGRAQALEERGIAPHLRGPIDHETDMYRAPHKDAAYQTSLIQGETVNPGSSRQSFIYSKAG